ncbi:DUF1002 domain-containing protein [bacterium D16-51]|nr:DUF1002 domain-containing protein [bacterium D16-59]RKI59965.1 DUF1002 domain-containing protein [bacterium D16-51]
MIRGLRKLVMAGALVLSLAVPVTASADAAIEDEDTSFDRYLAFGADLKKNERETVLSELGITEADVADYKTIQITNQEEHDYLGSYIDASVIGTRALSSVMVVKTEKDTGIHVETKNIGYCTPGMYCNALVTAGLTDANVTVVGPFNISGTSALVGAMKAYATMTGEEITEDIMDTATDELVTTAELGESMGDKERAAELIAAVKQKVFSEELTTATDIRDAVEASARALNLNISDEDVENIVDMMEKVSKVDIDVDAITEQAKGIYDKLKDAGVDFSKVDTSGLFDKIGSFFAGIFEAIADFFTGLFG